MSGYAKQPESRNITVTITAPGGAPEVITEGEARASSALHTLQEMADQLASLKTRLQLAMDAIAAACNAWHCQECSEWTVKNIPFDESVYCPRCAPVEAYCPF